MTDVVYNALWSSCSSRAALSVLLPLFQHSHSSDALIVLWLSCSRSGTLLTHRVNLFWEHHGELCFALLCCIRSAQIKLPVAPATVQSLSIFCAVTYHLTLCQVLLLSVEMMGVIKVKVHVLWTYTFNLTVKERFSFLDCFILKKVDALQIYPVTHSQVANH